MRLIVSILFAAGVCASSLTALAAEPAGGGAPQVPHMSREEALASLKEDSLALVPSNFVGPIMNSGAGETGPRKVSERAGLPLSQFASQHPGPPATDTRTQGQPSARQP